MANLAADRAKAINDYYGKTDLGLTILAALEKAGKDINALTRDDIASFDEFHIGGREVTRELAHLADLQADTSVLDLGCGIGGAARTLASEFGCEVTGIDLVEEYYRTAQILSTRVGQDDKTTFQHGDATDVPFADDTFDVVWLQHMAMNIDDKPRLFNEVRRVLRPTGRLALYEICAGSVNPPHFPVPWAGDSSINSLVQPQQLRQLLRDAGFNEVEWRDVTPASLEWFQKVLTNMRARPADAPPPLGLNLLMGATTGQKAVNSTRNMEEDRIRIIQGVLTI
jgi:SAM-dependent methyltransferase